MTDERPLNVRIAEARGVLRQDYVPAYGLTWADTGPLLEEMLRAGACATVAWHSSKGFAVCLARLWTDERGEMSDHMTSLCAAIGEAWLAWKKAA